jgi:hypothetical protein
VAGVPCLQGRVPCFQGTAVNAAIRLRFPSSSRRNRPTTAQFSVQPSWETCTAGRARRDAQMHVTREETEKKHGVGGPSRASWRASRFATWLVWWGRPVCAGSRSSSGAPGPGPMRRAGSLLGPPGLLLPATPVFADVPPVYERLNRLRVTVDPAATAAAIWSSDAVGHILSIPRPRAARTPILEIPGPSPRPFSSQEWRIASSPGPLGCRPGRPSRRARLRLGRGSPRAGPRDRSRPRSPSAAGDAWWSGL